MSVYNGAAKLRDSVQSILTQEHVQFEFIIVDDGSTDGSGALLDELASADSRIKFIRQHNQGLTSALIRACADATGEFIARQDCGDISLPGRLSVELAIMRSNPHAAVVSCGTQFVGPCGEMLYEVALPQADMTEALLTLDLQRVRGPAHHGSTMFRRETYRRAGGYRVQFYFAQDLDLWTRLVEWGRHLADPAILYRATYSLDSISSLQRQRQIASATLILECARRRRAGQSEADVLAQAAAIRPDRRTGSAADVASALYFVGTCLRNRGDPRAARYFRKALRTNPLHLKSALRLLSR